MINNFLDKFITNEYAIYCSVIQGKLLKNSIHWHLNGIFYVVPERFFQLLVILIYSEDTDLYIPVCFVLCSSKNKEIYAQIFRDLSVNILHQEAQVERITLDFESAEIQGIKTVFHQVELLGCKFHLQQALRRKAKKLGLMSGDLEKITVGLIQGINEVLENNTKNLEDHLNSVMEYFSDNALSSEYNFGKIYLFFFIFQ